MTARQQRNDAWGGMGTGWSITSTMIGGIAAWGGLGYLADRWIGTDGIFFAVGAVLGAAGAGSDRARDAWVDRLEGFFDDYDVLLTPTLAQSPPPSRGWNDRSWIANVWRDSNYAPFAARFNLAAVPAASVPWGIDTGGLPLAVQLVAWRGGEQLLIELAAQLESLHPWPRFAPGFGEPVSPSAGHAAP